MPLKLVKGRYEIKAKIGEGGRGVVYRAYDPPPLNRDVALKTLHPFSDRQAPELFYRDCEALRSLNHPNIVEIFDMGELEENGAKMPFFVMPLLVGKPLDELIQSSSHRLSVARIINIVRQACHGLQAAHDCGVVHRDLKPSNVFVMDDGSVKIIDFGVAQAFDARNRSNGSQKRTLRYMAPEQVQFKPVTPQSDVFSLGVVCYEALTRRQPFRGATEQDVVDAILNEIPPPISEINPTVSETISKVVLRAMAKQPWRRFSSARELSDMLEQAIQDEPGGSFEPARIQPGLERAPKASGNGGYRNGSHVSEFKEAGNVDSGMALALPRAKTEPAIRQDEVSRLLARANAFFDQGQDPLALEEVRQILELDSSHAAALELQMKIENRRGEREIDSWILLAEHYVANHAYAHAREALESVLSMRPAEARASQLLGEVESREQEYLELLAEKAQVYQNAFNSWKNGEVSEALSQMSLVLELDRRAPDNLSEEGGQSYQSFYNAVLSEYDAMNNAYAEARRAADQGDFEQALAACNAYLARYPSNTLFQAFRFDLEKQSRRGIYIPGNEDRQLGAKLDLKTRQELPGAFERDGVADRRELVNPIVEGARQIPNTIYSLYQRLSVEVERLQKKQEQRAREGARAEWIKRIERSLEMGEYSVSSELVAKAREEFAGDSELAELEELVSAKRDRAEQVERLVKAGRDLCAQGSIEEGLTSLRKAIDLDERNSAIRNTLVQALVDAAQMAIANDRQRAQSLVEKALDLDPSHTLAQNLRSQISAPKRDQGAGQLAPATRKPEGGEPARPAAVPVAVAPVPAETQVQPVAAKVEWAAGERPVRIIPAPEPELLGPEKPWVLPPMAKPFFGVAGAILVLVMVLEISHLWRPKPALTASAPPPSTASADVPPAPTEEAASAVPAPPSAQEPSPQEPAAQAPPAPRNGSRPISRLDMRDFEPGAEVIIDGRSAGKISAGGTFSRDLAVGDHQIKLLTRNQELLMSRNFRDGSTIPLSGKDFEEHGLLPPLGGFLAAGPSAGTSDRPAEGSDDDLMWAKTEKSDTASLNAYVGRFPGGRHVDEARSQIAALTKAPGPSLAAALTKVPGPNLAAVANPAPMPKLASVPPPDRTRVERTSRALVDDKSAVLKLIRQYQQAYQNKSVDQLKTLLPNIGPRQVRALNDFFGHTQLIKLNCRPAGNPVISGDIATLKFTQTLTYEADSENNTVSSKLIMRLRKLPSDSGTSDWHIQSIR